MAKKKVVVISDLHCGHIVGLTHPGFDADTGWRTEAKGYQVRRAIWDFYAQTLAELRPIHALIVNGDCIDGKGSLSGGTEQLTLDTTEQIEMAEAAIREAGAKEIYMSYGTGYHVGRFDDWEKEIANHVNAVKIGGADDIDVNGVVINYRHKVGRSSIPHGRGTPLAKEAINGILWGARGEYPKADIYIRSHVHYYCYIGEAGWVAMTTPALQGYGSKYGAREVTGTVDIGLVSFEIWDEEKWGWTPHLLRMPIHKPTVVGEGKA